MNREAMLEVAKEIRNKDHKFDMTSWSDCIAGTTCKIYDLVVNSPTSIQWAARNLLGLNLSQETKLFFLNRWPFRYQAMYLFSRRMAAAAYIRRLVKDNDAVLKQSPEMNKRDAVDSQTTGMAERKATLAQTPRTTERVEV